MEPHDPISTGNERPETTQPVELAGAAKSRAGWRRANALGLPAGSVRALLALIVFGGIWWWLYTRPDLEVPTYFRDLLFIIMGHYFAARRQREQDGPNPLFLPKGTIRSVLLLGFAAVAAGLYARGGFRLNDAWMTLLLVAGFMLGVLVSLLMGRRKLPRPIRDAEALVSLAAAIMLLLLVFGVLRPPGALADPQQYHVRYRLEDAFAAVVGYYFGSRS